ncbi:TetR/AcrR family transcriptional regulator [Phenylobacterium sp.]|uniref:TetR/AcrR family transcriptional regulator n=1 Tax=Phenylobacterium sp. TaxID=1871053 RepID=UPI0025D6E468|nr:TetR/AcrR family transcriptional regulator [Phenylobacterium sp.]MBX3486261.1 TetR/AcrR family transcriptional regulator [Phenylobacterium sp.]
MGRVKGLTPQDTRRRVVDGAADAFAELGVEAARVADIARAAGLSAGALYNHFDSKAELVAAVIEDRACEDMRRKFQAAPTRDVLALLLARGKELATVEQPAAPLMIGAIAAARDPEIKRVLSGQVAGTETELVDMIAAAQQGGHIAGDIDARAAARFMYVVLLGAYAARLMDLPDLEPGAWDHVMTKVFTGLNAGARNNKP